MLVRTKRRETLIVLQGVNVFPRKNRWASLFSRVYYTFI